MGLFQFDALVGRWAGLLAELEITLLRPEPPGGIVHYGGDIDNRLKTLFDAMAVPSQQQALPPDAEPGENEYPFFCVLEDDRQITKLTIHTERLWESVTSPHEVEFNSTGAACRVLRINNLLDRNNQSGCNHCGNTFFCFCRV
jgi:hypothetical protein